jgi:GT2 family glycosyltransferase
LTVPVGVVVVTWHSAATIGACLESLPAGVPVVVVDNDSSDDTAQRVSAARPEAVWIPAGANLGFGAACNLGASRLPAHDLLFLNPDAALGPGTLEALHATLRASPSTGAVGPRIVGADGLPEWSWGEDPTVRDEFVRSRRVRRGEVPPVPTGPVDWVTGGCCLVRREAWEAVTGFDPGYFLYFEDLDLCRRIRQAGFTVLVVPEVEATHVRGHSSGQASQAVKRHYRESQRRYYARYGSWLDRVIVGLYARWRAAR